MKTSLLAIVAIEKAEALSKAAGIRLGRIVDIQESNIYPQMPYDALQKSAVPAGGVTEPTQFSLGENTVSISISLSYQTH